MSWGITLDIENLLSVETRTVHYDHGHSDRTKNNETIHPTRDSEGLLVLFDQPNDHIPLYKSIRVNKLGKTGE